MILTKEQLAKAKKNSVDRNLGSSIRDYYKKQLEEHYAAKKQECR